MLTPRSTLASVAVSAVLISGCGTGSNSGGRTAGNPPAPTEIRHDLDPLTARFPALGHPISASWVTWHSASGGAPGPTTYWIDAVVAIEPSTTAALVAQYQPNAQGQQPPVQDILRSDVPAGPFLTGPALDQAFSTPIWRGIAYLNRQDNQLVLHAIND